MTDKLLNKLRALEEQLHRNETRCNPQRLNELFHPEFEEIGRSGRHYDRTAIMSEISEEEELPPVRATNYSITVITHDVALLTYQSAHIDSVGEPYRHTLRSSLWVQNKAGWQLRFHQGTPTNP